MKMQYHNILYFHPSPDKNLGNPNIRPVMMQ